VDVEEFRVVESLRVVRFTWSALLLAAATGVAEADVVGVSMARVGIL
jgi:hypothetical protein